MDKFPNDGRVHPLAENRNSSCQQLEMNILSLLIETWIKKSLGK